MAARWRVKFDEPSWYADLASSTPAARAVAVAWRRRVELIGYLAAEDLHRCDPEHDLWPLPLCLKTRLPDPSSADVRVSPWGVVLEGQADEIGPYLEFVAFGLRHPESSGSNKPSVYALAHARL